MLALYVQAEEVPELSGFQSWLVRITPRWCQKGIQLHKIFAYSTLVSIGSQIKRVVRLTICSHNGGAHLYDSFLASSLRYPLACKKAIRAQKGTAEVLAYGALLGFPKLVNDLM